MTWRFLSLSGAAALALLNAPVSAGAPVDQPTRAKEVEAALMERIEFVEDHVLGRLGVGPLAGNGDISYVAFTYSRAFEGHFAIVVAEFPESSEEIDGEEFVSPAFTTVQISERWDKQTRPGSNSEALHEVSKIDRFYRELDPLRYSAVRSAIEARGFNSAAPLAPPNLGTDGNSYGLAVVSALGSKRIHRRVGDDSYVADLELAKPLFDIARQEAPNAKSLIDKVWNEVSVAYQR